MRTKLLLLFLFFFPFSIFGQHPEEQRVLLPRLIRLKNDTVKIPRRMFIVPTRYVHDTVNARCYVNVNFQYDLNDKEKPVLIKACYLQSITITNKDQSQRRYLFCNDRDDLAQTDSLSYIWDTCNGLLTYWFLNQHYEQAEFGKYNIDGQPVTRNRLVYPVKLYLVPIIDNRSVRY